MGQEGKEVDKHNLVYAILFFQGIACQFPWNALITATGYYTTRLAELDSARHFLSHFSIIFMTCKAAFMCGSMAAGTRLVAETRALWSAVIMALSMAALFFLVLIDEMPVSLFYGITLFIVGLVALSSAWSEMAVFEMLAGMPPRLTQAYLVGQSLAGVIVCIHSIALLAAVGGLRSIEGVKGFAIVYFGITLLVCSLALLLLIHLPRVPHFRYLVKKKRMQHDQPSLISIQTDGSLPEMPSPTLSIWQTTVAVWRESACTFIVHVFNMTIFPTLLVSVNAVNVPSELFPSLAFLAYHIGDLTAKLVVGVFVPESAPILWLSIIRVAFIILYLGANLKSDRLPFAPFVTSDYAFFLVIACTSITGGYLSALSMLYGPKRMREGADRPRAAAVVVVACMMGLTVGAYVGLAIKMSL